jgi:DNA primase catalytic subunit
MEEKTEKRRVQIIAQSYYSRKEIQETIYKFCKNRETVPRYLEGFGKRPDILDYPSDIMALVKRGATSFHCSEEIWSDPMKIDTEMTPERYNEIRTGWDFLIDIDSKYIDYSKLAANLIIKFLEHHGVENIGIKFSGSKGFHIVIPWKAFPEEIDGEKAKDNFPEWPRAIANYISENLRDKLVTEISKISNISNSFDIIYLPTKEIAIKKDISIYECKNCKTKVQSMKSTKKSLKCNICSYEMEKMSEKEIYIAESNQDNSQKSPSKFIKRINPSELIDTVDIILVAPRHLFRVPYSLHEKTSLTSCVIKKEDVANFEVTMADPLKIKVLDFYPVPKKDEGKKLLLQAIDWSKKKEKEKKFEGKSIDLKGLTINEEMFPEAITKILEGIKGDGRKRALSILISFFYSLDFPKEYVQEKISEWNKKNAKPLKEGYIKSQIEWSSKNKRLPPNYDKTIYREIIGYQPETFGVKNPINYTISLALKNSKNKNRNLNK